MSNLTDGKKALAAGEFDVAEKKLIKALDRRPDDSELWWALMLCKFGFRNDAELESAVKAKYERAAENGDAPPPTPFDTSYCKNALKYAASSKRRDFVERVSAELNALWQSKRGKTLKAPKTDIKTFTVRDKFRAALYTAITASAVGGGMGAYAIFEHETWALWTGFIILIVFSMTAFFIRRHLVKKYGEQLKLADILFISMFAAVGIAVLVSGAVVGSRSVLILGIAVLVLAALLGGYRIIASKPPRSAAARKSGVNARANAGKADGDRNNIASPSRKIKREKSQNEYQDKDD